MDDSQPDYRPLKNRFNASSAAALELSALGDVGFRNQTGTYREYRCRNAGQYLATRFGLDEMERGVEVTGLGRRNELGIHSANQIGAVQHE